MDAERDPHFAARHLTNAIKRWAARTESSQMTASALFYLAAYVVIVTVHSYPGMILAMVLATLEMLISPAIPLLSRNVQDKRLRSISA